jgi:hypothetical protein
VQQNQHHHQQSKSNKQSFKGNSTQAMQKIKEMD